MKLLWLFFIFQAVYGRAPFQSFYSRSSRLCHSWTCINEKLGLPKSLTSKDSAREAFTRVLPQGPWQDVLENVLDNCYTNRSRRYVSTCPGQALLHCVVDQMINNCPEENWIKDNGCSPISSLAGFKQMFTVSRYENLQKNLEKEHRPKWFLEHYFDQKCCDLPVMFNSSVLQECGFNSFITYYDHGLRQDSQSPSIWRSPPPLAWRSPILPPSKPPAAKDNGDMVLMASLSQATPLPQAGFGPSQLTQSSGDRVLMVSLNQTTTSRPLESQSVDPLDCCDITEFIQPSWRNECGFHLTWKRPERLVITEYTPKPTTEAPVTTTSRTNLPKDLMLLPHSCHQETCVFKKLGVIDESGLVDTTAFRRMMDNFTEAHSSWNNPTARVLSKCLSRGGRDYEGSCEINKMLACTLDVLTENCPFKRKSEDPCRHSKRKGGCQISSSKFRPKNRRQICLLPPLVDLNLLFECGLDSLYKTVHVEVPPEPKPKKHFWSAARNLCHDQKPSTTCLMNKMGVLTKYRFMDYFRMKDRIRQFTTNDPVWSSLLDVYMGAFINVPMYGQHCSSQKKMLNVIDAMLMTCPVSKRKDSPQCKQLFRDITDTTPSPTQNYTRQKLDEMRKHYHHIFLQSSYSPPNVDPVIRKPKRKTVKKPIYNYGFLDSEKSPQVNVIDIKPAVITRLDKPLVLAPVYLRDSNRRAPFPIARDNFYESNRPFWLHDNLPRAPFTTATPEISTDTLVSTEIETTTSEMSMAQTTDTMGV